MKKIYYSHDPAHCAQMQAIIAGGIRTGLVITSTLTHLSRTKTRLCIIVQDTCMGQGLIEYLDRYYAC